MRPSRMSIPYWHDFVDSFITPVFSLFHHWKLLSLLSHAFGLMSDSQQPITSVCYFVHKSLSLYLALFSLPTNNIIGDFFQPNSFLVKTHESQIPSRCPWCPQPPFSWSTPTTMPHLSDQHLAVAFDSSIHVGHSTLNIRPLCLFLSMHISFCIHR